MTTATSSSSRNAGVNRGRSVGAAVSATRMGRRLSRVSVMAAWVLAPVLPLVGLVSLLLRAQLDPAWTSPRLHFVLFLSCRGRRSRACLRFRASGRPAG